MTLQEFSCPARSAFPAGETLPCAAPEHVDSPRPEVDVAPILRELVVVLEAFDNKVCLRVDRDGIVPSAINSAKAHQADSKKVNPKNKEIRHDQL